MSSVLSMNAMAGFHSLRSVHARSPNVHALKNRSALLFTRRSRGSLVVQANELNKWAGRQFDDQCDPNPFDEDTALVLLRVLTARSVKRLLHQLQELDLYQAQWLNNYAAENPPTEGDKFIEGLLDAKGTVLKDPTNKTTHHVDPQNLAHRILQIREDMTKKATLDLPAFVERRNTSVLRNHLEKNTFVSGSNEDGYKERRGYFRSPRNKN